MAYQRRILATGTAFGVEDNGVWSIADFNGDGPQDLVYIKTRNTGTGRIEVHGSRNESRFQEHSLNTGTCFAIEDNGAWLMQDWNGDGKADLVYINTRNTGTGTVEVHVADAASGYQRFAFQTGTCFDCEDNGIWTMSRKGDLVFIKTRNCDSKMIEYHVASKASNYQQFATGFGVEDYGTWCLAPKCDGDFADLYYIKARNTAGMVEVHAVSASSGWKSRLISVATFFDPGGNGQWLMADFAHQRQLDLVYIKTRYTGTGKIEVHVVESQEVKGFQGSARGMLRKIDGSWVSDSFDLRDIIMNNDKQSTSRCYMYS
ncbi:hypothetical protein BGZ58_002403 [Dissophora ornata]|nr:hypothetical protein BGZ58_002403 [Dissophora ornata]